MSKPTNAGSGHRKTRRPATTGLKLFVDPKTTLALGDEETVTAINGAAPPVKTDYEIACEASRQKNARLLDDFVGLLRSQRRAPRTIKKHRDNVDFFINEFLLYEDAKGAAEGSGEVDAFLGEWFIRKAMWSTPRALKSSASSLYLFYAFMAALDRVTPSQLAELKQTIALGLPEWQARCERYNDGEVEDWRGMD